MALIVQKYGGTAVADSDRIRAVADHVARTRRRGEHVVVVVSAMGKTTDELERLSIEVSATRPGRELDMLLSSGERIAMALLCMALADLRVPASSFTGSQAGIITDTTHTRARIVEIRADRIRHALELGQVPVVAGFQGVSTTKDVTTLGRGGSDTTAVALAATLGARACQLYTDVTGVFSADPRIVPTARRISRLSWEELLEMCAAGCPKPEVRAAEFARAHRVPLEVRSAFTWEPGSIVREEDPKMEQAIVSSVVHEPGDAKVTVTGVPDKVGIAAQLFGALAENHVNVDMIVQSTSVHGVTDISFTVPGRDLVASVAVCREHQIDVGATDVIGDAEVAKVSIIGAGMKTNPGVAATVFRALAGEGVNIEMISTSPIRISCVIREADVERAVQALHTAFELDV